MNKITIIGVGLIGGSIGLACKEKNLAKSIVGVGRNPARLERARARGAIDAYELELAPAVAGADLVILATPVGTIHELLSQLVRYLEPGAVVTDVGSTKSQVVETAERLMPAENYFVGGHPIAGREDSGVEAALADLFCEARTILTPTAHTHPKALARVRQLWEQLGSQVILMDVEQHDRTLAIISHLPHMVAYSIVNAVAELDKKEDELIALAAGGFGDFTRISASDPLMWRDVCLSNAKYIVEAIEHFQQTLDRIKQGIKLGDADGLLAQFKQAQQVKRGNKY